MRYLIPTILCLIFALPAQGEPIRYVLDNTKSNVGFGYTLIGQKMRGQFQDYEIDLKIDFKNLQNSSVDVIIKSDSAKTSLPFVTEILTSKSILDAKTHPDIRFKTTSVSGSVNTASLKGVTTIKGINKVTTLTAKLFRPKGSDPLDRSNLILKITGQLDRRDFNASDYEKEVDPIITLDITAIVARQ